MSHEVNEYNGSPYARIRVHGYRRRWLAIIHLQRLVALHGHAAQVAAQYDEAQLPDR